MLKSLRAAAEAANRPEWGYAGPHDSGTYCSRAEQTGFFHPDCGNWRTEYGNFFLSWYSGLLINHVEKMVAMGNSVLAEPRRPRSVCTTPAQPCSALVQGTAILQAESQSFSHMECYSMWCLASRYRDIWLIQ